MSASSDKPAVAPASTDPTTVVVDLGKHRRKRIKRLRKGQGALMDDVNAAVHELRAAGRLGANAQAVVVVVRQKRRRLKSLIPGL